jgi:hypothetical protein
MDTVTGGLKLGHVFEGGSEGTIRLEYYEQLGRGHPAPAIGSWSERDLFPKVDAFIAQVGFSTRW